MPEIYETIIDTGRFTDVVAYYTYTYIYIYIYIICVCVCTHICI